MKRCQKETTPSRHSYSTTRALFYKRDREVTATKQTDKQRNVHTILDFPCRSQKKPRRNQKHGIEYLPVPVIGLDVVGEGLGLDVGRVVVTVVVVVVVYQRYVSLSKKR